MFNHPKKNSLKSNRIKKTHPIYQNPYNSRTLFQSEIQRIRKFDQFQKNTKKTITTTALGHFQKGNTRHACSLTKHVCFLLNTSANCQTLHLVCIVTFPHDSSLRTLISLEISGSFLFWQITKKKSKHMTKRRNELARTFTHEKSIVLWKSFKFKSKIRKRNQNFAVTTLTNFDELWRTLTNFC